MALLGNYTVLNKNPGRSLGGPTVSTELSEYNKSGAKRNIFQRFDKKTSIPEGTTHPYSWVISMKSGGISARIFASGSVSANLVMGQAMEAGLSGAGALSGDISALVQLAASIGGTGTLNGAMVGTVAMAASLAGSGNITAASNLIARIEAALSGQGGVSADLRGKAGMSANIFVNSGTATTNELVQAIWNAVAADNNNPGTMGQKLNGAGSAGDPWSTTLPGGYTADQAGAIVDRLETLIRQVKALTTAGL